MAADAHAAGASDIASIALSLISHTNAGKTTLARTLLDRDIGDVRDAPHVTQSASVHRLVESAVGDTLSLWDTPGFGDSARLAKRLAQEGSPIGWFMTQVWDRYRDRSFWLTQQAVRNVRDEADVVLYLVNASETPEDAGYLAPELAVLAWIGKPVIALLNQAGPATGAGDERADEARWRARLAEAKVREVLALDAFARCWVQEFALFAAIARVLPAAQRPAQRRLTRAWEARRRAQFDAAMGALALPLAAAASDRVALPDDPLLAKVGRKLGIARATGESAAQRVEREMAARVELAFRACTDRLLEIHGLAGSAAAEAFARLDGDLRRDAPLDEGKAAMMGGIVSGAVTGLTADLAAGGLTLGGGMLAGALLGALGGAGIARGMNVVRERKGLTLAWDAAFLDKLAAAVLLRYLAVAHFGRGRGAWTANAVPEHWRAAVAAAQAAHAQDFAQVWAERAANADLLANESRLRKLLARVASGVLAKLYPDAGLIADAAD
ncbi:MAG: GTPase domain-containing protein [Casimicrobiaceae bacterium]